MNDIYEEINKLAQGNLPDIPKPPRLVPGHSLEVEEYAARLLEQLIFMGFISVDAEELSGEARAIDREDKDVTEEDIRAMLAKALEYESWGDLIDAVKQPHRPVYIDPENHEQAHVYQYHIVLSISNSLGIDYAHGMIWGVVENAGIGYNPAHRRQADEEATPWGPIQDEEEIAPGIREVSTAAHGGIILSEERQDKMPQHLSLGTEYYEEDCNWALVAAAFPDEFQDSIAYALGSLGVFSGSSIPRVRQDKNSRHEQLLSECLVGYVPPDEDPFNREMTTDEEAVIEYLSRCVLNNKRPPSEPEGHFPTLQEWVEVLNRVPRTDTWPMTQEAWKQHWHRSI